MSDLVQHAPATTVAVPPSDPIHIFYTLTPSQRQQVLDVQIDIQIEADLKLLGRSDLSHRDREAAEARVAYFRKQRSA